MKLLKKLGLLCLSVLMIACTVTITTHVEAASSQTYVVYLEGNGGTFDGGTSHYFKGKLKQGEAYGNLPTPTYEGYDFAGWYTAASGGSLVGYDLSSMIMGSSEVTYYAHWTPKTANNGWYTEWSYTLDSSAQTIAPKQYNGSATTYTLPSSATIDGVKYTTLLGAPDNFTTSNVLQTGSIQNLSFSAGIKTTRFLSFLFYNDTNLLHIDFTNFNTNNVAGDMRCMFMGCTNLQSINFSGFSTSNCLGFQNMFTGCKSLKTLDLSGFDFSKSTSFSMLFDGCESLTYVDTSRFGNTPKYLSTIQYMFRNCSSLTSLDLSNLNTDNVIDMRQMFQGCSNLTTLNISSFNTAKVSAEVDGVSGIDSIFKGCNKLKHLTLGPNTDFSKFSVTDASFPVIPTSTGSYTGNWSYNSATNHSNTLFSLTTYDGSKPGLWTWETQENTNHVVYLEGNGGTFDGGTSRYFKGSLKQGDAYGYLPTPTQYGYDFAGWYTSATGGYYVGYDLSSKTMGTSDVTYYAHWTKKAEETQKYTVTYVANGGYVYGSTTYSKTVTKGSTLGELPEPTRSGYTFVSWTDENGNTVSADTVVKSNMTLTAQWKENHATTMCDVTFNANGGNVKLFLSNKGETYNVSIKSGTTIGSDFNSVKAVWSGHTFDGWYTAQTGGEKFTGDTVVSHSITLYAHWDGQDSVKTYTVTYDAHGGYVYGSTTYSKTVTKGSTLGELPEPTRSGYTFVSWTDENGNTVSADTVVKSNMTLTAQWQKHTVAGICDVTFNGNGGRVFAIFDRGEIFTTQINAGSAFGSDFDSVKATWDGHTFDGWYTEAKGGTKFTSTDVITGPIVLYAHWDGQDTKTLDLQVTLTVSGNLGSRDKEFAFTTQFPSSLYGKTLTVEKSDGSTSKIDIDASGVATFTLKHGETLTFKKLTEEQANAIKASPDFCIKENSYASDGYTTEYTASADDSGNLAVVYRNTRKSAVPTGNHIGTGITVSVLIGIAGLAFMLRKKRK